MQQRNQPLDLEFELGPERVERQLRKTRERLLDLTFRNRLLSFRETKTGTLRVIDEIPAEIFDLMVLQGRTMSFLPRQGETDPYFREMMGGASGPPAAEGEGNIWSIRESPTEVAERHKDRFLQTNLESQSLQKKLFFIYRKAQTMVEEQGMNILFLALGFLYWRESPNSEKKRCAPLILLPVEVFRVGTGSLFRVKYGGDELRTNISLQQKLKQFGVGLPDFECPESKSGIYDYFREVKSAIACQPEWSISEDIFLGFFSFTKILMYRDLDPLAWPEEENPSENQLIRAILDPREEENGAEEISEERLAKIQAKDLFNVLDADPSQLAVIEAAKAGRNLVVEGPPGTGKSQTITNLIAELLAAGKSVLFVSQKMAALEVVKKRLEMTGLGQFCLELHSHKAKKKEVLRELGRSLSTNEGDVPPTSEIFRELERLGKELNEYARALREPFPIVDRSPFSLFEMVEKSRQHFRNRRKPIPCLDFAEASSCNPQIWRHAREVLNSIEEVLSQVQPIKENPWQGCLVRTILPADERRIRLFLEKLEENFKILSAALARFADYSGAQRPFSLDSIKDLVSDLQSIAKIAPPKVDSQTILGDFWSGSTEPAFEVISLLKKHRQKRRLALSIFRETVLAKDLHSLFHRFTIVSSSIFRIFKKQYWATKKEVASLYQKDSPRNLKVLQDDLKELDALHEIREKVAEIGPKAVRIFGNAWRGLETDPEGLSSMADWIIHFHQLVREKGFSEGFVKSFLEPKSRTKLTTLLKTLESLRSELMETGSSLFKQLNTDPREIFGSGLGSLKLNEFELHVTLWHEHLGSIQIWSHFLARRQECLDSVAGPLMKLIDEGQLNSGDLVPAFDICMAESILKLVFEKTPSLAQFVGPLHEQHIQRFAELDQETIELNRKRLKSRLLGLLPQIRPGSSPQSEAGILLGELSRKRGHMPIRKLMAHAGGLIVKLKPCFLMSPLSIAQFLDPRNVRFDVIVFDEASQVKPEDALGALLRGKRVVVVGDTRQLPPTSFFDKLVEENDEDEGEEDPTTLITETESVLHQCKRCFPTKILRWHYRSKHESLIAVSNQEFYDNQLLFYPSPFEADRTLGLQLQHCPGTVYDRGRSAANRQEAAAVAKACVEHFREFPDKSLGVGAFSLKQQQTIWEEVERERQNHPGLDELFSAARHENFFVKNLETIQGDERDVILLSIGYGFDASGRLSKNFGPLNKDGGWRRLNVLITRAREKLVVFSNFKASDLPLEPNSPRGIKALKVFLSFAETRKLEEFDQPREDTDSPFEDSVLRFLADEGFDVHKQVGCAGFRVDLGIVDPSSRGTYMAGIECDGAKYHSSAMARERDRLRQQILEEKGWRILRIWSTDWYRNPAETKRNLLKRVYEIQENPSSYRPMLESVKIQETTTDDDEVPQTAEWNPGSCRTVGNRKASGDGLLEEYQLCSDIPISTACNLLECPSPELSRAVVEVVRIEQPIHFDEMVRRIRTLWGLKRSGHRIHAVLMEATKLAQQSERIFQEGPFLWMGGGERLCKPRHRKGDPAPKIDMICDEEIAEAIKIVLKCQFRTAREELAKVTARSFGIHAVHETTSNRILKVVDKLLQAGVLRKTEMGMVDLREETNQ